MTQTTKGKSPFQEFMDDWWKYIGMIIPIPAAIIFAILQNEKIATLISTVIVIAAVTVFYLFHRKKQKSKAIQSESSLPQAAYSAFRDMASFTSTDPFDLPGIGRQNLARLIFTKITRSPNFFIGILCGESGCGKSSVLDAGVYKMLKANNASVYFLKNPRELIQSSNPRDFITRIEAKIDSINAEYLLVDQFEEIFIEWKNEVERKEIASGLVDLKNRKQVKIFLAVRKDFIADFKHFQPVIASPLDNLEYVQFFQKNEAKDVIEYCARHDGIEYEDGFIAQLSDDLAYDNTVRPVELQIVCTFLSINNSFNKNDYTINNGVTGILSNKIKGVVEICNDQLVAKKILRMLCDFPANAKSQPIEIQSVYDALGNEATLCIEILEQKRIIIKAGANKDKISLIHDYLVQPINIATSDITTEREKANEILKYYLANFYGSNKIAIPFSKMRFVKKFAEKRMLEDSKIKQLLRFSISKNILDVSKALSLFAIVLLIVFGLFTFKKVAWSKNAIKGKMERPVFVDSLWYDIVDDNVKIYNSDDRLIFRDTLYTYYFMDSILYYTKFKNPYLFRYYFSSQRNDSAYVDSNILIIPDQRYASVTFPYKYEALYNTSYEEYDWFGNYSITSMDIRAKQTVLNGKVYKVPNKLIDIINEFITADTNNLHLAYVSCAYSGLFLAHVVGSQDYSAIDINRQDKDFYILYNDYDSSFTESSEYIIISEYKGLYYCYYDKTVEIFNSSDKSIKKLLLPNSIENVYNGYFILRHTFNYNKDTFSIVNYNLEKCGEFYSPYDDGRIKRINDTAVYFFDTTLKTIPFEKIPFQFNSYSLYLGGKDENTYGVILRNRLNNDTAGYYYFHNKKIIPVYDIRYAELAENDDILIAEYRKPTEPTRYLYDLKTGEVIAKLDKGNSNNKVYYHREKETILIYDHGSKELSRYKKCWEIWGIKMPYFL